MTTTTQAEPSTDFERLRDALRGPVFVPGDEGYDAARALWIDPEIVYARRIGGTVVIKAGVREPGDRRGGDG